MYRNISDFIADWKEEEEATLKIFNALNSEVLTKTFDGEVRRIGRLTWHIAETVSEMLNHAGLNVSAPDYSKPVLDDLNKIISIYETSSKSAIEEVTSKWSKINLEDKVTMYGQQWSYGKTLQILIQHQIHHRGQLTVLMRLAGLKVPGIYGPSKEEWTMYNLPVHE